jgi:hypothetical protein
LGVLLEPAWLVEQGKNKEVLVAAFRMDGRIPSNAAGSIGSSFNLLSLVIVAASLHGIICHAVHDPTNHKAQKVV